MNQVVVEGLLVMAAGKVYVSSRPPVLARPRRGPADLPHRERPDVPAPEERTAELPRGRTRSRWLLPTSVGVATVAGLVGRAAVLLVLL